MSSADKAYNLNFNASGVNPSNEGNRYVGRPLRCLMRDGCRSFAKTHFKNAQLGAYTSIVAQVGEKVNIAIVFLAKMCYN